MLITIPEENELMLITIPEEDELHIPHIHTSVYICKHTTMIT